MRKVLIVNGEEIAVRTIRTLKKLGVHTIATHSEVNKNGKYIRLAHESCNLHDNFCYLDIGKIIETVRKAKADTIHPSYGFLSENYLFVKAYKDNNIVFIGSSWESIEKLEDKELARKIAQEANVPIPPDKNIYDKNN